MDLGLAGSIAVVTGGCKGMGRAIGERWGSINALINTVGPADGFFEEMDDAGWDDALALGLMAAVRCTRAALPLLRAAEWARIVNFAAHSIQRQNPRLVAYTASKAAVASQEHVSSASRPRPGRPAGRDRQHHRLPGLPSQRLRDRCKRERRRRLGLHLRPAVRSRGTAEMLDRSGCAP